MSLKINHLAEEDRPREKLLSKGIQSLTNAELVAILIGSGYKEKNAVELSKEILGAFENDLNRVAKVGVAELIQFKGIGEAKAISIITALEIGRRRKVTGDKSPQVSSSQTAFELLIPEMQDLDREEFWVLLLNRANKLLRKEKLSIGGKSGTIVDPKILFKVALNYGASGIIVAHNHPSGNLKPSNSDLSLTKKIKEGGSLLEIPLLDHLIVSDNFYFSFADEGLLA